MIKILSVAYEKDNTCLILDIQSINKSILYYLASEFEKEFEVYYQISDILKPTMKLRLTSRDGTMLQKDLISSTLQRILRDLQSFKAQLDSEELIQKI